MAFGLINTTQALQRLIDNILMSLDYVFSFLDDDRVYSKTREQHWEHLRTLFAILAANGLALNLEKCECADAEMTSLDTTSPPPASSLSGTTFRSFWTSLNLMTARHCNGS
jgi:hypothetical protein